MTEQTAIVQFAVRPGRNIAVRLTEGMPVESTDGAVGEIADVIIDPRVPHGAFPAPRKGRHPTGVHHHSQPTTAGPNLNNRIKSEPNSLGERQRRTKCLQYL